MSARSSRASSERITDVRSPADARDEILAAESAGGSGCNRATLETTLIEGAEDRGVSGEDLGTVAVACRWRDTREMLRQANAPSSGSRRDGRATSPARWTSSSASRRLSPGHQFLRLGGRSLAGSS